MERRLPKEEVEVENKKTKRILLEQSLKHFQYVAQFQEERKLLTTGCCRNSETKILYVIVS